MKDKKPVKKAAPKKVAPKKPTKAPVKKPTQKPTVKTAPAKKPAAKPAQVSKKDVYAEDVRRLEAGISELTGKIKNLEKRLNDYEKTKKTVDAPPANIVPPTPVKTMFDSINFDTPAKGLEDAAKVTDKAPSAKAGPSPILRACAAMKESKFGSAAAGSPFSRR